LRRNNFSVKTKRDKNILEVEFKKKQFSDCDFDFLASKKCLSKTIFKKKARVIHMFFFLFRGVKKSKINSDRKKVNLLKR